MSYILESPFFKSSCLFGNATLDGIIPVGKVPMGERHLERGSPLTVPILPLIGIRKRDSTQEHPLP